MTRIKPTPLVVTFSTTDEVDNALAHIAARRRQVAIVETGMNEKIDKIKQDAAEECEPALQEIVILEQAILRYAEAQKATLFGTRKSLALTFGIIGYRASSKLKTLAKWTWERVLQTLRDNEYRKYIRVKEDVDKEALRELPPELLAKIGVKIVQEDVFYYELEEQELPTSQGNAA